MTGIEVFIGVLAALLTRDVLRGVVRRAYWSSPRALHPRRRRFVNLAFRTLGLR